MCFSFRVSLATFISSWSISLYLLNKGLSEKRKQLVIALMIFSSMQVPDAILWYTGMKRNNLNFLTTSILIPLILSLQILYNVYVMNKNKNKIISLVTILFILYIFFRFQGYSSPLCGSRLSSPIWGSNELKYWELIPFVFLILYPRWTILAQTLFIILPIIYLITGGGYGSLWCAIANIIAFYYLYKF